MKCTSFPISGRMLMLIPVAFAVLLSTSCSKSSDVDNTNPPQPPGSTKLYDVQIVGPNSSHTVYSQIALQADGKIVAFKSSAGNDSLVRLLPSGVIDPQFVTTRFTGNSFLSELLVQADGKILLLGQLSLPGNPSLIRLNANGQTDNSFKTLTGNNNINCMMLQPDGKILVGGSFNYTLGTSLRHKLLRLNTDGSFDNSFTSPFSDKGSAAMILAMDSQGRILVGGKLAIDGDVLTTRDVVRLKADGSVDPTFNFRDHVAVPESGAGNSTIIRTIAADKQDRVLIGGDFFEIQSPEGVRTQCNHIVRILSNGTLDKEFQYADKGPGRVTAILPLTNGDIFVGRNWAKIILGFPAESVNLYNTRGEYRGFELGYESGYVTDIIQETGEKILVAGGFSKSSSPQVGLCRLTQK